MRTRHALRASILAGLFAALLTSAAAQETRVGNLVLDNAWTRATPQGAPVGGGYLTIENLGATADRLVTGSITFADRVEIHAMSMDGDVMTMRQVEGGLEIPAGETITLKPGGLHLMFVGLVEPLVEGEAVDVTLTFETAGTVTLPFPVARLGATGPGGHSGEAPGHGMSHDSPPDSGHDGSHSSH
jgi:periplasmic copper chaperone A